MRSHRSRPCAGAIAAALTLTIVSSALAQDTTSRRVRSAVRIPLAKIQTTSGGEVALPPRADTSSRVPFTPVAPAPSAFDTTTIASALGAIRTLVETTTVVFRPIPPSLPGNFYIGVAGGASVPAGAIYNGYNAGWNVTVPMGWESYDSPVGLRLDLGYDRLAPRTTFRSTGQPTAVVTFGTGAYGGAGPTGTGTTGKYGPGAPGTTGTPTNVPVGGTGAGTTGGGTTGGTTTGGTTTSGGTAGTPTTGTPTTGTGTGGGTIGTYGGMTSGAQAGYDTARVTYAYPQIWSAMLDAKLRLPVSGYRSMSSVYVVGGGGVHYFRNYGATFASTNPQAEQGTYKPTTGGYTGNSSYSALTRFGLNAGAGIEFGFGPANMFVEGRYVAVLTRDSHTNYWPVIVGMTWR